MAKKQKHVKRSISTIIRKNYKPRTEWKTKAYVPVQNKKNIYVSVKKQTIKNSTFMQVWWKLNMYKYSQKYIWNTLSMWRLAYCVALQVNPYTAKLENILHTAQVDRYICSQVCQQGVYKMPLDINNKMNNQILEHSLMKQ